MADALESFLNGLEECLGFDIGLGGDVASFFLVLKHLQDALHSAGALSLRLRKLGRKLKPQQTLHDQANHLESLAQVRGFALELSVPQQEV